jgi:hypothetical protein
LAILRRIARIKVIRGWKMLSAKYQGKSSKKSKNPHAKVGNRGRKRSGTSMIIRNINPVR